MAAPALGAGHRKPRAEDCDTQYVKKGDKEESERLMVCQKVASEKWIISSTFHSMLASALASAVV